MATVLSPVCKCLGPEEVSNGCGLITHICKHLGPEEVSKWLWSYHLHLQTFRCGRGIKWLWSITHICKHVDLEEVSLQMLISLKCCWSSMCGREGWVHFLQRLTWGIGTGHGDKTDRSVLCVWQLLDRTLCRAECSPRLLLPPPCCSFCLLLSVSMWVFQSEPNSSFAGLLMSHSENLSHSSWRLVTTSCPSVILTIFCIPSSAVCLWIRLQEHKPNAGHLLLRDFNCCTNPELFFDLGI